MNKRDILSREILIRGLVVAGLEIIFGYSFYRNNIFSIYKWQSDFLFYGITLAIANASFSKKHYRDGIAVLLVWFMASAVLLIHSGTLLFYIRYGFSLICISGSVYLFYFISRLSLIDHRYQHIVIFSILFGFTMSLIGTFSYLFVIQWSLAHHIPVVSYMYGGLRIGVLMGLLLGLGNLLTDYLLTYIQSHHKVAA